MAGGQTTLAGVPRGDCFLCLLRTCKQHTHEGTVAPPPAKDDRSRPCICKLDSGGIRAPPALHRTLQRRPQWILHPARLPGEYSYFWGTLWRGDR